MPGALVLMKKLPVGFAGSLLQFAALFQSWLVSPTQVASARLMEGRIARAKARARGLNLFSRFEHIINFFSVRLTFIFGLSLVGPSTDFQTHDLTGLRRHGLHMH